MQHSYVVYSYVVTWWRGQSNGFGNIEVWEHL